MKTKRKILSGVSLAAGSLVFVSTAIAQSFTTPNNSGADLGPGSQSARQNVYKPTSAVEVAREAGSVNGRVFNEAETLRIQDAANLRGIGGVKVILKSTQPGYVWIVDSQISDLTGAYSFPNLSPGEYSVDIDPVSVPAQFRVPAATALAVRVETARSAYVAIPMSAKRSVTGFVFIDKDADGQYKPGKDLPVEGASVTVDGDLAVSDADGRFILRDLPAGRIGLLVNCPKRAENTHVVLDLGAAPVMNRVVNIPLSR